MKAAGRESSMESPGKGGHVNTDDSRSNGQSNGCKLADYAAAKKLPVALLGDLGVTEISYLGAPALRIPYRDCDGEEKAVRFRVALFKGELGDNRFRWKQGAKPFLYGLDGLAEGTREVVLVEGESDVHTLRFHGIAALGLPGAGSWNEQRDAPHLAGAETIYVVLEPDAGGAAVARWLVKSPIRQRVRLVKLDGFKDPSALHVADPAAFKARWENALETSTAWAEYEATLVDEVRQTAWGKCAGLADASRILDRFAIEVRRAGVVGEEKAVKLIFLALTSRLLLKPVSLALKGPSSAGKSFLVETVLSFFPAGTYHMLTGMSERALAYSEEPLSHRFLVICEANGSTGEIASYLVRSLLSEGRLRYEFVEKTAAGLHARVIEREGPTGLLVTTTKTGLHPENETRMLSVTVTDTPEQTKAVMRALAAGKPAVTDREPWHAFQEWIGFSATEVTIPFAAALAEMVPPIAVRLRRDFGAILNLIRAHALLHQATRTRDEQGRIVASLEDYAEVLDLVAEVVAEGIEATVSPTVRAAVDAVAELTKAADHTTKKAVAERLGIDPAAAWRRLQTALQRGYVRNLEEKKGRPAKLVVGDPLPREIAVLPSPELLAQVASAGNRADGINPKNGGTMSSPGVDCAIDADSDVHDTPAPVQRVEHETDAV